MFRVVVWVAKLMGVPFLVVLHFAVLVPRNEGTKKARPSNLNDSRTGHKLAVPP
jgi:hypothetical protein